MPTFKVTFVTVTDCEWYALSDSFECKTRCTHHGGDINELSDGEGAVESRVISVDHENIDRARVSRSEGPSNDIAGILHPVKASQYLFAS